MKKEEEKNNKQEAVEEARYTAREWAIISGGHSLEDIQFQEKHKLFNFDKY